MKEHKLIGTRALALLAMCAVGIAKAGTLNITVIPATQYEDGTALSVTDITQTRVEYGSCAGAAFGTKAGEYVIAGNGTTGSKTGLAPGTYCQRAYTTAKGKESGASNVVTATIDQSPPRPPTISATATAALVPIYNKRYDYWAMGDQVGTVKIGAECDASQSFGNNYYAVKDPKAVTYYAGRRPRAVVAVKCGLT